MASGGRFRRGAVAVAAAVVAAAALPVSGATVSGESPATKVVMVAGNTSPPSGDVPMVAIFETLFDSVVIIDDDTPELAVAVSGEDPDLVVVSSSVVPGKVGTTLRALDAPLITWEGFLSDEFGFSSGGRGEQGQTSTTSRTVDIVSPAHPIAAGLSGSVAVTSVAKAQNYVQPSGGVSVATERGATVINAWETGDALANGPVAPSRRVLLFPVYDAPGVLTQAGIDLIIASAEWAVDAPPLTDRPPVVDAGTDVVITWPTDRVQLDWTITDDGLSTPSFWWTMASGPDDVIFEEFEFPDVTARFPGPGVYVLQLTATDGVNAPVSDVVQITVNEAANEDGNDDAVEVLYVAGSTRPPAGDAPIIAILETDDRVVTVADDDDLAMFEPNDYDLIVVSTSVSISKVGATFTNVPVPLVTWEPYLFDDMGLSNSRETQRTYTTIEIVDAAHPLAGGTSSGLAAVYTRRQKLSYGEAGPAADVVAHVPNRPDQHVVFGYEAGAPLVDGTPAPARRVALFMTYDGARRLTDTGSDIVGAAFEYALAGRAPSTGGGLAAAPIQLIDLSDIPVEEGDTPLFPSDIRISANGRYATFNINGGLRDYYHIDLVTRVLTDVAIDRPRPSEDGTYVVGSDFAGTPLRENLATGEISPAVPGVPDAVDLPDWVLTPSMVSDDGRFLLLHARSSDNFLSNAFVWDLVTDQLVTPASGLPSEAGRVASAILSVRNGRNVVQYRTYSVTGAPFETAEVIDLLSGERTTIAPPDAWKPILGGWALSSNHDWIVFPSDEADVVPGLEAARRYYRYHRPSGVIDVVPLSQTQVDSLQLVVFDTGGVGFTADTPAGKFLYTWPGAGPVVSLLRTPAGAPADSGEVPGWSFSPSGETVLFSSWARNLVEGLDPDESVLRLYLIDASADPAADG